MDINFKDFAQELYEKRALADHQVANGTKMLIFLSAWCDPEAGKQINNE